MGKTVSIFKEKNIASTVPNKVIVYDDQNRIVKETETLMDDSDTSIVKYYKYNGENGKIASMTIENYYKEFKLNTIEESYFENIDFLVKKFTKKYFVNDKLDFVEENEYEIECTVITNDNIDSIFDSLSDPEDHEVYTHILQNIRASMKEDINNGGKPILLKHFSITNEDEEPIYYVFTDDSYDHFCINYCDGGYVIVFAREDTGDEFKTSDIKYFKSRTNYKDDNYCISEIYDGLYLRNTFVNTWEDEIDYVETTFFYGFTQKGIYTKMDKNGAITERLYYVYDGSELVKTINGKGETVESYHIQNDSQILSEYPVVNTTVTEYYGNNA